MTLQQSLIYVCVFFFRDIFDQVDQDMPHAINVTPAEQEAIERVSIHCHCIIGFCLCIFVIMDIAFPVIWIY